MAKTLNKKLNSRISGLVNDSVITDFFDVTIDTVPNYKQGAYRGRIMNEFQPITKADYSRIYTGVKIPYTAKDNTIRFCFQYKKKQKEEPEAKEEPGKFESALNFVKKMLPGTESDQKSAVKNERDWGWDSNPVGYTNGRVLVDGYRELQPSIPWTDYDSHSNSFFMGAKDADGEMKTLKEIYDEGRLYCMDMVNHGGEICIKDPGGYRVRHYFQRKDNPVNRIHQWGCLLTCMADIFSYYKNEEITPPMVNDKMNEMNRQAEIAEFEAKCDEILKSVPGHVTPITVGKNAFAKPGVYNKQSGYVKDTSCMMTDNVAIAYGYRAFAFDSPNIKNKEDKDKYDEHFFTGKIKERINNKKPTIVKLLSGQATHFVLVVGLCYYGREEKEKPDFFIINDPGADDANDMKARYISCETGYSERWNRTIVAMTTVD